MSSRYLPARTILFEQKAGGATYRIPALLHLPASGTLLAFAEKRRSQADVDADVLVVRRGEVSRNSVEWWDMEVLSLAQLRDHRSMNPCPVYDSTSHTLFLFFIAIPGRTSEVHQLYTGVNVTRLCYVSSSDQGRSWRGPTDLTDSTLGCSVRDWATFGLGPGHGIQLQCGRLLIPAYAYRIDSMECFGRWCKSSPHSFAFYSDDQGKHWSFGEFISDLETVECQLVALDEGQGHGALYCNARTPGDCRAQALSLDRGAAFQEGTLVPKLVEPGNGCHGSVVGFPAPVLGLAEDSGASDGSSSPDLPSTPQHKCWKIATDLPPPTWVVYCHPTSPTSRLHLGVYLNTSPRDPHSWSEPWVIYRGPSAYSDLAFVQLSSAKHQETHPTTPAFGCLYECGSRTPYETIAFSLFTVRELLHNVPHFPGETQEELSVTTGGVCCCIT
ncbi:sialidase-4 [Pristis pectinata]|uniref:sialidase-4 n=1 Tax=Pristis pectinata TaxID=685728 RepID=UPI00223CD207|nr:sialidase-4 [Pristis pectinata]